AAWRDQFVIPDDRLIYLDGNSLGRLPKRTVARLAEVINNEWAGDLIGSWDHWVDLPGRVGDRLAPLIGAGPGEVIVHDSTSINIYQLLHATLRLQPDRPVIAIDPADFPTDTYIAEGVAKTLGYELRHGFDQLDDVAVCVRSLVDYRSAALVDLAAETARASAAGALVIWDLSHAVGAVPIDVAAAQVDLAVGCTYKYLNGGPGAPAFCYVAARLQAQIEQPIHGWFGQRDQFAMAEVYDPQPDLRRMLIGTPSVLALAAAEEGIALSAEAGIAAIAAKSTALTGLAIERCDHHGLMTSTPRDPTRRGAHVAVHHAQAPTMVARLAARRVIADLRQPDIVRLGCSALTTRYTDVWDGVNAISQLANELDGGAP
ncbi:MAG TPA: aminotransferase class V-fold PLP-dependent enzyme, partial [Ilumatobacteraceae bacterium]|nr:aminotransferase class V-fold PLP-dependent enzyme [Ilumatobacteraceae bacterium]